MLLVNCIFKAIVFSRSRLSKIFSQVLGLLKRLNYLESLVLTTHCLHNVSEVLKFIYGHPKRQHLLLWKRNARKHASNARVGSQTMLYLDWQLVFPQFLSKALEMLCHSNLRIKSTGSYYCKMREILKLPQIKIKTFSPNKILLIFPFPQKQPYLPSYKPTHFVTFNSTPHIICSCWSPKDWPTLIRFLP